MLLPIYWALAVGLVVLTVLKTPRTPKTLWTSEESAHSAAAARRAESPETRRETRYRTDRSATASVLGDPNRQTPCRVVNASRSGLRIVSNHYFVKGDQVCVQWGEEFFVGTVLYTASNGNAHVAGLELLSGNHSWHPFERLRFWRRPAKLSTDI